MCDFAGARGIWEDICGNYGTSSLFISISLIARDYFYPYALIFIPKLYSGHPFISYEV